MFRTLIILSALALPLAQTQAAPVPKGAGSRPVYFPTKKGTKWTYTPHGGTELTFVITGVTEKDGNKIISVGREVEGRVTPEGEVKLTKKGTFELVGTRGGLTFRRYLYLLDRPVKPGDEWEVDTEGPHGIKVTWKRVVTGPEKVKVPAGTFEAIRVENTYIRKGMGGMPNAVIGSHTTWYAPGVGLIRQTRGDDELGALKAFTPGKG